MHGHVCACVCPGICERHLGKRPGPLHTLSYLLFPASLIFVLFCILYMEVGAREVKRLSHARTVAELGLELSYL